MCFGVFIILLSVALQPNVGPWSLFGLLILYTVGSIPWTGDQHDARPLPTLLNVDPFSLVCTTLQRKVT
jgi:hypothetical protein